MHHSSQNVNLQSFEDIFIYVFFCLITYNKLGDIMLIELFKKVLFVAIVISTISCSFIQKTKSGFKSSKFLVFYSFIINMVISILFCKSFTDFDIGYSIWVGFFSFIGADTIFKTLEGKISSYSDLKISNKAS